MYLDGVDDERWQDLTAVHAHTEYVVQAIRKSARL
jgi:hypothetical protein